MRPVCLDRLKELGIFQIYWFLSLLSVLECERKLANSLSCWKKHGIREKKNSETSVPRPSRGTWNFSNLLIFKPLEHSWAWKKTNLFYFLLEKICLWEKKSLCFPRPVCLDCFEELGFFKFINIHASWAFLSVKEKLAYSIFYWKKHGCRDKKISKFFPRQVCLDRLRKLGIFQIYKYLSLLNVLERVLVYPF